MSSLLNALKKQNIYRNKYLLVCFVFLIWLLLFDSNRLDTQLALMSKVQRLENKVEEYKRKIEQAKKDAIDLEVNKEKYAREKYYMHTPGEDVFIVE